MQFSSVLLLTLAIAFLLTTRASAMAISEKWVCTPCIDIECDERPMNYCVYGEARDACGRRVCAKGPMERCGGSMNVLGVCGEGLMCKSDERCHGCLMATMECSNY
ncbi:neuroparsin-A-like [Euwallacea fornicatus]|uniref:neuroparsin-A-like n=1 Tax=Euwallacea fornicatus TaxID=995702 RepID=UPI00338FF9E0